MALEFALEAVSKGLKLLTDQLKIGVNAGNNLDVALRGLGTSFENETGPLTESMNTLRGSLSDRLIPHVLALQAGMQGNTLGVQSLINQQKLTGTAYAGTAKAFAALEAMGGLQRDTIERLSTDIVELGGQFGVTTDVLVKALEGLNDNLIDIDLMGLPDHVTEALTEMQAMAGSQLAGAFDKAVDLMLSPKIEAISQRALLGLPDPTEVLANTKTREEALTKMISGFVRAGTTFEDMASKGLGAIAAAEFAFGPTGKLFVPLAEAFTERARQERETVEDFGDALNVIKSEVFVPLQQLFMTKFTPIIQRFAEVFSDVNNELMPKFTHWLDQAITVLIGWITQIPSVLENVLNAFHGLVISFKAMDWGGLWNNIVGVTTAVWEEIADQFNFAAKTINLWALGVQETFLSMKLWVAELFDIGDNEDSTIAIRDQLEQVGLDLGKAIIDKEVATGALGFGKDLEIMGPGGLKVTFPAEDNPATHMKRMGELFTDFKNNFEAGDAGTRFFGPVIDPWTTLWTGIEENTKKTADAVVEAADVNTGPMALGATTNETASAMRSILGIPGATALESIMSDTKEVLIDIKNNQESGVFPGHDPFSSEAGPTLTEL